MASPAPAPVARPDVQVAQTFRTVSPTILTPTLAPCIVGLCKQIVDAVTSSATGSQGLNAEASIALPGFILATAAPGAPPAYTTLDGKTWSFSVKGGPAVDVVFSGTSLSVKATVAQINDKLATLGVTEAYAEKISASQFILRTAGTGEFETITTLSGTDAEVIAAFGLGIQRAQVGAGTYAQSLYKASYGDLPDPRGNLDEVVVDASKVRVFLGLGGGSSNFREASRTKAFLRGGGTNTTATMTGTVDLTGLTYGGAGTLVGKKLALVYDGTTYAITFGAPANATDVITTINGTIGKAAASIASGTNYLVWTSQRSGYNSYISIAGDATTLLGFTVDQSARGVSGVISVDDGNGDGVTPILEFNGADFTAAATAATVTGTNNINGAGVTDDLTFIYDDGTGVQTHTFSGSNAGALVVAALNAQMGEDAGGRTLFSLSTNHLKIDHILEGVDSVFKILGGTALVELGLTPELTGTADLTALAPDPTQLNTKTLPVVVDGTTRTVTFSGLLNSSTPADIAGVVNAQIGDYVLASASGVYLRIQHLLGGPNRTLSIGTGGTATTIAGFLASQTASYQYIYRGVPQPPAVGDEIYINGGTAPYARITQVAPGANVSRLKIDKQVPISGSVGSTYYVVARALPAADRPDPELTVNSDGSFTLKQELLRDLKGALVSTGKAAVYVSYEGVRVDVSAKARNASLLTFNSTTDVETYVSPVDERNPFALGLYFAALNAPGTQITGLGVDAFSADEPYGTADAFQRAAVFLESQEVYGIAPLTHDITVAQAYLQHVLTMSAPEQRGERIVVCNLDVPTHQLDVLVASGFGNTIDASTTTLETGIANLDSLLQAAGIDAAETLATEDGVFLDLATDTKHYSISAVNGSVITIRTAFTAGTNDDSFYSTTVLDNPLVNVAFSIKIRGAELVLSDGTPDKDAIAVTVAQTNTSFGSRRFWSTFPATCVANVGGVEKVIEGFYMNAGIVGTIAQQSPSQSLTNFPLTGYTQVPGSQGYFTERQLDQMAGGGTWVIIQRAKGAAPVARHALTSDMSSVETRTDIVTKVVDYAAKFYRSTLRSFIGRYNITQAFLDTLGSVAQGIGQFLVDANILLSASLNSIKQNPLQPDRVGMSIELGVPYPCNYIDVELVI